jgi:hypothetical protein
MDIVVSLTALTCIAVTKYLTLTREAGKDLFWLTVLEVSIHSPWFH